MADTQLQSLRTSSLYRVLTKGENDSAEYTVSIGKSHPPASHELLVVKLNNGGEITTATQGQTHTVDLPKMGCTKGAFLRIGITGLQNSSKARDALGNPNSVATTNTVDRLHCAPIPGVAFIKKISLKTHSRTLEEIEQSCLVALINSMDQDRRDLTLALAGAGIKSSLEGTANILKDPYQLTTGTPNVATNITYLHVPIPLHAFESKYGMLNSFLETVSLEIEFNPVQNVFSAGYVSGGSSSAGTSYKCDLCLQTKSYRDDIYRNVLSQYRKNPSVQELGWRLEKVGSKTVNVPAINDLVTSYHNLEFDIHTSASSLSRAIIVTVFKSSNDSFTRTDADGTSPVDMQPDLQALAKVSLGPTNPAIIDSVQFEASGRTVFNSTSPEMELMAYANKHFSVPASHIQSCFIHRFATQSALKESSTMSGACSFAGLSSQRFVVKARGRRTIDHYSGTAATQKAIGDVGGVFTCEIWSVSYNVKSTNSSSGAIRNSLSV